MPTPPAPTNFQLVQAVGSGAIRGHARGTATWSHTGTNLDRFEMLEKKASETWAKARRVFIGPKAQFSIGGTSYVAEIPLQEGHTYLLQALSNGPNDASSTGVTQDFNGQILGKWLLPIRNNAIVVADEIWVGAGTDPVVREHSVSKAYAIGRAEAITTQDVLHLEEGRFSGPVRAHNEQEADEWRDRLEHLVSNFLRYDKVLYITRRKLKKVHVFGNVSIDPDEAGERWYLSCDFRELA